MRPAKILLLTAPFVAAQNDFTNIVNGITSIFGNIASGLSQGFVQVSTIGGSVYTVVTAAVPTEVLSIATQVTSIGGSVYTVLTSDGIQLASNIQNVGTQVTSFGGSVYTLVTSAAPGALSSFSTQLTSINGSLVTVLGSSINRNIGTKTTTQNGQVYTVATNGIGLVVSTISAQTTSTSSHSGGAAAMITQAPVLAGGVFGAGMAVAAML